jgi:hypothetical protein
MYNAQIWKHSFEEHVGEYIISYRVIWNWILVNVSLTVQFQQSIQRKTGPWEELFWGLVKEKIWKWELETASMDGKITKLDSSVKEWEED